MNDEALFELVRGADPLPGVGDPPLAVLERVLASPRPAAKRLRAPRRVVLLACALAAAIAPLAALAATNHWWFLQAGSGLPTPGRQPTVVRRGSWSGHPWTLVAYPSKNFAGTTNGPNGLCWGVTFSGRTPHGLYGNMFYGGTAHGADDGMACGSLVGIQKPKLVADLAQVGEPVPTAAVAWSLSSARGYPSWISGVVVSSATRVAVRWPARKARPGMLASPPEIVRAATFPARVEGYRARLFAVRLPAELSRHTRKASVMSLPSRISGTNGSGRVVACDWPGGKLPLSSCRP